MGIGNDVLVGERAGGVGGNPGFDGSMKKDSLVRIIGDPIGLSDGGSGF